MKNVAIKINEVTVLKKKKKEIRLRFTSPVIQTLAGSRRKIDSSSGFETQDAPVYLADASTALNQPEIRISQIFLYQMLL